MFIPPYNFVVGGINIYIFYVHYSMFISQNHREIPREETYIIPIK
jgi:hypothetical protein